MSEEHIQHFERLKEAVRLRVEERLSIRKEFADWSVADIQDFRVDLEACCKSSVSEKWFYTHLKNTNDKLPRIDVLNLLSEYAGYKNWDAFIFEAPATRKRSRFAPWLAIFGGVIAAAVGVTLWLGNSRSTPVLTFIDAYTQEPVDASSLTFSSTVGKRLHYSKGKIEADSVIVDGAYYKERRVGLATSKDTLSITLFPDDYALMLNFFSRSTTEDFEKRREQLLSAIHPDAKIFQSHPKLSGIELLNREEFIYRLTLPINQLRNLEIQDIVYKDEKIYRLRFIQNTDEDE
ncbi:MAG: hypothetical protein HWE14_08840 [Flavobacteriia bacterium]|nr:hypothetical protein [Flavobacteriia bacterium]